jgi:methylated-DNA-protein-cysteine methyltransferase related protein
MVKNIGKNFSQRVVEIALAIPKGRVSTYGRMANAAGGNSFSSQSITAILGRAESEGIKDIPYHRIVYVDGRIWIDENCKKERMRLYKKEGIEIDENRRIKNFNKVLIEFNNNYYIK